MEDVKVLCEQLDKILKEIQIHSTKLLSLEPVSHLSKSKIQWTGGIFGVIQEIRENNRLVKMMNEPISEGRSFYQLCFWGCKKAEEAVSIQLRIQESTSKNDLVYYQKAKDIVEIFTTFINAYFEYSPDMAYAPVTVGDIKDISLGKSLQACVKDELVKMDLPPELEDLKKPSNNTKENNSGCLGAFIALIVGSISLFSLGCYEFYQYLV